MRTSRALQDKINRVVKEEISIVAYNPNWNIMFRNEAEFLKKKFPDIIKRVEHFGSTAVPGLSAKPVVDLLVEVTNFKDVKKEIVPVLENLGYDYFWRPEIDKPPYYAWFIKRDRKGIRTHHIHMVKEDSKLWDRLYFRDYLRERPEIVAEYQKLKIEASKKYSNDREAYTKSKTNFITKVTEEAKKYYHRF